MKTLKLLKWSALLFGAALLMSSCVAKKKYLELQGSRDGIQVTLNETRGQLDACNTRAAGLQQEIGRLQNELALRDREGQNKDDRIRQLQEQLDFAKTTNANLLERLSDLSVVSKAGAESIQKSLESINRQGQYIKELTSKIQAKDSVNLVLVMNLKRSLEDVNDEDIQVEVRGGVVYVSIADKLLFRSGSAEINPRAETVLGKVAKVINDHKDIDVMVEGHTDNVPISNSCMQDNWDLSVKRATSVVRFLQTKYAVGPDRLTAAGRGEYVPKTTNDTPAGRQVNRRTEIVITPKLDQFFKLLEAPPPGGK